MVKDDRGDIVELRCTYDPATKGGDAPDGRKVKATLHWVSVAHAVPAEVRLYERLFLKENPDDAEEGQDYLASLNPHSLEALTGSWVEPSLAGATIGSIYQFERQGYFCVDPDTVNGKLVFNRAVSLKDEWAKIEKAQRTK
jgi:glutaminyl-tRNA synthetase